MHPVILIGAIEAQKEYCKTNNLEILQMFHVYVNKSCIRFVFQGTVTMDKLEGLFC